MPKASHKLYWLAHEPLPVRQLVQEGFNWIDCAAGWGEPNANWEGWEQTSFQKYCELLPVSAEQWLPGNSPEFFPTPMYQDGWGHPAPKTFFTHIGELEFDRSELCNWYTNVFLQFDSSMKAALENALFQPHLLVRLGYHLAKKVGQTRGVDSIEFQASMSAVGTGCRGIDLWICDYCFRRSRGELRICDMHSQAKIILDLANTERNVQFQKARATRKAALAIDPNSIPKRQFNGYWELDLHEFELQVGGILWQLTGVSHRDWLSHVLRALTAAPLVSSRLSDSFISDASHLQIEQLQRAVGSREWLVSRWPTLIPLAETWLRAEGSAAPGSIPRGLTEKNRERVEIARGLLEKGVAHSQVAEHLSVSRSHLSHLLRRASEKPPR